MSPLKTLILAGAAALCAATAASAQDAPRWFLHVGPADVILEPKASMTMAGQPVPGAGVKIRDEWTAEAEIGYYVTPDIAVAFAGGYPPTLTVKGTGSVSSVGTIGQITAGPSAVNASYHFNRGGMVQPYIGAGVAFMIVWNTKDGALSNLKVDDAVGPAVQVGSDFMFSPHWGAYVDYKRAWLDPATSGLLGGVAPVTAKVDLNANVVNAGVTYRF